MSIMWQPGMTLEDVEKQIIDKAMIFWDGDKAKVAQALGVSVKTIYNKLDKYYPKPPAEKKVIK